MSVVKWRFPKLKEEGLMVEGSGTRALEGASTTFTYTVHPMQCLLMQCYSWIGRIKYSQLPVLLIILRYDPKHLESQTHTR